MNRHPSIMSLHLRYRLWIAEMNFFINIFQIFDDYLKGLTDKKEEPELKKGIVYFEKQFIDARKEIDGLRHEMHLLKMKLGAYSREGRSLDHKTYKEDHHADLKHRFESFRKTFEKTKMEFSAFEAKWLI